MVFIETPTFTRLVNALLDDEAYRGLQNQLVKKGHSERQGNRVVATICEGFINMKKELFGDLLQSLQEAKDIASGNCEWLAESAHFWRSEFDFSRKCAWPCHGVAFALFS